MNFRYVSILCAVFLTAVASVPADIVWSGDMYQRAYSDIPAIDMNQDGITDFTFTLNISSDHNNYSIDPINGQVVVEQRKYTMGSVSLAEGIIISADLDNPGLVWPLVWESAETRLFYYGTVQGNENYGGLYNRDGYVGVSFDAEGETHYGWIQTSHFSSRPSQDNEFLFIHGWAYESTPGAPIIAGAIPEPSTGVLTMVGSLALLQIARARRRRKQGCTPVPRCRAPKASTASEQW